MNIEGIAKRIGLVTAVAAVGFLGKDTMAIDTPFDPKCPTPFVGDSASNYSFMLSHIYKLYPELAPKGLTLRCVDFPAKEGVSTLVANFSDHSYDQYAAYSTYYYLDFYGKLKDPIKFPYSFNERERVVYAMGNPILSLRTLVILPEDVSPPDSWKAPFSLSGIHGATISDLAGGAFSYVKLAKEGQHIFDTPEKLATLAFATEACQQTLLAVVVDERQKDMMILDPEEQHAGQELVCNSFGYGLAAAFLGIPFDEYEESLKGMHTMDPRKPDATYQLAALPDNLYKSIPTVGSVLR